ncbi:hypothetical protein BH11ARM1_BH11ARM1_02940 [soil metagenome]
MSLTAKYGKSPVHSSFRDTISRELMTQKLLATVTLALGLMSSVNAQTTPSELANRLAHGENLRVVVYGTSLTANGEWPKQLEKALNERYSGQITLVNGAGSGMNSDWGVENLTSRVLENKPDVVFIEFAVNDSVARFNLSIDKSRHNLESMIDQIRSTNPGTEIIRQVTNPVTGRPEGDSGYRPHLDQYFALTRDIANKKHTVLIDHEKAWQRILDQGRYGQFVPDGLHPNPVGYAKFATPAILDGLDVPKADAYAQSLEVFDVLVYGDTSAAVTAAIQVQRMGKKVLIISPTKHIGGLTINGLGWTDLGNAKTIGGLSKEFYHRIYETYSSPDAWNWQTQSSFGGAAQGIKARDEASETMWTFEPHVAEEVFRQMMDEHHIPIVYGRLDLNKGVYKRDKQIFGIRTEAGFNYTALSFIDATYEGDLMAKAGVTYTVGREPNSQYGEALNGSQRAHAVQNQLPKGVNPAKLTGVEPFVDEPDGTGDDRIQAYCYRMVLTNEPRNRIEITQPEGYEESDYEILFRAIEAGQTKEFFKLDPVPNKKTDSNNSGGISTDFIGQNYKYPDANYEERDAIAAKHRDWQLGLLYTLQHSDRVPESIRTKYAPWGLPKDEFVENGGWPYGLYIREARRMIGETVITEGLLREKARDIQSIGMGSYKMDSHNVRRMVGPDGHLMNEGDVQQSPNGPYSIDFGAILPKTTECTNLFVPVAVSASHIAYGSIRMEPVFMILGQSAATAAVIALETYNSAQGIAYETLRERLLKDGQVLKLENQKP